jgi:hypothetical protein
MQNLNWTNQCSLFMTVRHIFEISEDDHPPNTQTPLVTHARESANIDELQTIELEINWKANSGGGAVEAVLFR